MYDDTSTKRMMPLHQNLAKPDQYPRAPGFLDSAMQALTR
jgi:hypothetical protein